MENTKQKEIKKYQEPRQQYYAESSQRIETSCVGEGSIGFACPGAGEGIVNFLPPNRNNMGSPHSDQMVGLLRTYLP